MGDGIIIYDSMRNIFNGIQVKPTPILSDKYWINKITKIHFLVGNGKLMSLEKSY